MAHRSLHSAPPWVRAPTIVQYVHVLSHNPKKILTLMWTSVCVLAHTFLVSQACACPMQSSFHTAARGIWLKPKAALNPPLLRTPKGLSPHSKSKPESLQGMGRPWWGVQHPSLSLPKLSSLYHCPPHSLCPSHPGLLAVLPASQMCTCLRDLALAVPSVCTLFLQASLHMASPPSKLCSDVVFPIIVLAPVVINNIFCPHWTLDPFLAALVFPQHIETSDFL